MRKRTLARPLGLIAILALALVAAGCGGGGSSSSGNGTTSGSGNANASGGTLRLAIGSEPPSLDPGLATDTTSALVVGNINEPIIRLGPAPDLKPLPGLAKTWDVNGANITLHLRNDAKWTDGKTVTADDVVWSWLRTISPQLGADYAYQFYSIKGAQEYNSCKPSAANNQCDSLKSKVAISAPDATTVKITLTSPQPWFVQQMSHTSFIPVSKTAVTAHGEKWTEPANIVTDGPFQLASWQHNARIDLVKWPGWRGADGVSLQRVNGLMLTAATTSLQAFEAGESDVQLTVPPTDLPRLKPTPEYQQYPGLGTYYYGLNVKNIKDVNQRRAMAMAVDRREIIDHIAQGGQVPATGFTPKGMPGFDTINPKSEWLPETTDIDAAKQELAKAKNPKKSITLYYNNDPAHQPIAVALQAQWKKLGLDVKLRVLEWKQFLEFLGPPPNGSVDTYRLGWIGDFVDAINFLELWTCDSGNNNSNFCDPSYDKLVAQAKQTQDNQKRFELYAQLEQKLFGPEGSVPFIPIYWYTYPTLERQSIKDTFNLNLLNQVDLTKVKVVEK
jgi:oligopeptide transport system substrate-binding protein